LFLLATATPTTSNIGLLDSNFKIYYICSWHAKITNLPQKNALIKQVMLYTFIFEINVIKSTVATLFLPLFLNSNIIILSVFYLFHILKMQKKNKIKRNHSIKMINHVNMETNGCKLGNDCNGLSHYCDSF
jgi:hypothetical protein